MDFNLDFISAKVEAAKVSKDEKKTIYILANDEGDCGLSKTVLKSTTAMAAYKNGNPVPVEEIDEAPIEEEVQEKKPKKVAKAKKASTKVKTNSKTKTKEVMATKTKAPKKTAAKKSTAKKAVAKKPAKKAAASNSKGISRATTLTLSAAQWAKLEKIGSIRVAATELVISGLK